MPRMWNASVEPQSVDTQRFCDLPSSFCPFSKNDLKYKNLTNLNLFEPLVEGWEGFHLRSYLF